MKKMIAKDTFRKTANDTPAKQKKDTVKILNHLLAEFLDLALITKQAHWNLRGPAFIAVHEMLDPFNDKLLDYADTIAERIVQLGAVPYGTAQMIVHGSELAEYPTNIVTIEDHLEEVHDRYAIVANTVRKIVEEQLADQGTLNFLTDASNDLDKYLWFIEAHMPSYE